ncbi:R106 protein [Spatholobus suberectus]|nr:R106 protein [Spatholobus suberectus]
MTHEVHDVTIQQNRTCTILLSQAKLHNNNISNAINMSMKKKGNNNNHCSPAVLYHYPCPDGAFAALAAHLYFKATSLLSPFFFPNTVYKPLSAEDLHLNEIGDLYLLDFVGPTGFVQEISTKVPRVIVLDHHKSALERLGNEASLGENVVKVIDMERSGATIAFDYFKDKLLSPDGVVKHPSVLDEFEHVRQLFLYIEDGDLWRWRLPNSKAFRSGLKDMNIEFDVRKNPSLFDQLLSLDLDTIISKGILSLSHTQKLIDDCLRKSYEIALGNGAFGHCLAVNADTALSELRSELGHQLAIKSQKMKLRGVGAVVYTVPELENDQRLKISLRSVDDEDTTPISQEFGGGGHRNASSFMLIADEFELWKV